MNSRPAARNRGASSIEAVLVMLLFLALTLGGMMFFDGSSWSMLGGGADGAQGRIPVATSEANRAAERLSTIRDGAARDLLENYGSGTGVEVNDGGVTVRPGGGLRPGGLFE
ncbi:MAG: hypothetical protein JKP98_26560 [Rhodobacteraceae bacterium]|jgi:hypothetical protein|nr:hypothetical protein [Paracoccaceae bacterium]MBL4556328.1 hypothetical protein [Paracoccaceae bacterium]MBL4559310.1 hypothetical protein [Paracoccaceae bacterium]HBG99243.1 hypothetical protein [Paracoccaceae bacterium]